MACPPYQASLRRSPAPFKVSNMSRVTNSSRFAKRDNSSTLSSQWADYGTRLVDTQFGLEITLINFPLQCETLQCILVQRRGVACGNGPTRDYSMSCYSCEYG